MARRVFLHIGLPKTATTYLQTIVWSNRDVAAAQGLTLPGRERRDHLWASRVVRETPKRPRPDREHEAWRRILDDVAAATGDVLISHEFFAAASGAQARAVLEALAPAEVHVVITAREPLGLFTASWQESLKNRGTTPMAEYGRTESSRPEDIWDWRTLDLRLVLRRWRKAVAADRIHVLPLDPRAARDEIWHRFAGLLGLDAAAFDTSAGFSNQSMGVVEAELLRRVNHHLHGFSSALDRGVWIRSFLADDRLVPRGGERFWPLPDQIEDCRRRGEATLRFLREHPVDVVGDPELLRVPTVIEPRRTPDSVTDAEIAAAGAEVIAVLLEDVRAARRGSAAVEADDVEVGEDDGGPRAPASVLGRVRLGRRRNGGAG